MTVHLVTQDRGRRAHGVDDTHVHPPKVEIFDLDAMTNTDPKGKIRTVEIYRVDAAGLYMSRPVVGHPELTHFESWLLPTHGLRVTRQSWSPGTTRDYDFYIDLVEITPGRRHWRTLDLYLDLLVRTGRGVEVLDTDELLAAVRAGLLDSARAERGLLDTYRAVSGISAHGNDVGRWLAAEGVPLSWQDDPRARP